MSHAIGQTQPIDCGHTVAAAHDRDYAGPAALREKSGHGVGAIGEGLDLEDAHRSIPEDGFRLGEVLGESDHRLWTDIDHHPILGHLVYGHHLVLRAVMDLRRDDDVGWQHEPNPLAPPLRHDPARVVELLRLDQALA